MAELSVDQWEAVQQMKNGCILCGEVGSGKSRTALAYYIFRDCLGSVPLFVDGKKKSEYVDMKQPRNLYIITTAKKRDKGEWIDEACDFAMHPDHNVFPIKIVVDSWNNIKRYNDVYESFFIFDEQRVIGSGTWVKTFLNITRKNHWILLSATPGDIWSDYIPVFVANGFYRNKTEFQRNHCVFSRFAKYPKIERYVGLRKLESCRDQILIPLKDRRHTQRHNETIFVEYDKTLYLNIMNDRWNPYDQEPIEESGKLGYLLRRASNEHPSRIRAIDQIRLRHNRLIIFYNYNYELDVLLSYCEDHRIFYGQWNGHKHGEIPKTKKWFYLVQYTAGCEGWNCIETNAIVFYSQSYSYRAMEQASGRIDRINTPFHDLYYYHFKSLSPIDHAISLCLERKRNFNETKFVKGLETC